MTKVEILPELASDQTDLKSADEEFSVAKYPEIINHNKGLEPFNPLIHEKEDDVIDISAEISGSLPAIKRTTLLAGEAGEWQHKKSNAPPVQESKDIADLYRNFVQKVVSYKRLTEEEEFAYGMKVKKYADADASSKLVVHNLRLVIKMAHQYRRVWTNIMDLIQEAAAGMSIAAGRWDPEVGTRFGTYAVYWIRAHLTKFLMTNGRLIHTGNSRAGRKLYYQLPKIRRRLLAAGKETSIANIAKEVGESEEEVQRVISRLDSKEASFSAPLSGNDGNTLGDMIEGNLLSPENVTSNNEAQDVMLHLVRGFKEKISDKRDLDIWTLHLVNHDPTSLVDLGKEYKVSKQRMGQLATRLKKRFRQHVIEELGPETQLSWLFDRD